MDIYICYNLTIPLPLAENYRKLCTIRANLFHLPTKPLTNGQGGKYWEVHYKYVFRFTASELSVQIAWMEQVGVFILILGYLPTMTFFFSDRGLREGELNLLEPFIIR